MYLGQVCFMLYLRIERELKKILDHETFGDGVEIVSRWNDASRDERRSLRARVSVDYDGSLRLV